MKKIKEVFSCPLDDLEIHPEVLKIYQEKNLVFLKYTMAKLGQEQPITVVKIGNKYFIVDGVARYIVAKELSMTHLNCFILEIPDNEILDYRIRINQKTKSNIIETCLQAEHMLGILGKSQGKKRDMLGFKNFDSDEEFGQVGKDVYKLTCNLLGLDLGSTSLRKLMKVFWDENPKTKKEQTGVLELIDQGRLSIDKAYKLLEKKEQKIKEKQARDKRDYEGTISNVCYKLYNKSSMYMYEVPDESVRLCIDSHPYLWLREYRNQDELCHGQEETVEEYVANFVKFCHEKRKKLVEGGVMITILGETYCNGYKGVCTKVETALENDGWIILDIPIWAKSNGKYAPHPNRFVNGYERIIVACKPGAEPFFQDVIRKSSTEGFKAKKTSSGGYYMASPESCITNVEKPLKMIP